MTKESTAGEGEAVPRRSVILGLTGSLGSGKSFVSSLFSRSNAKVICADELARDAVAPGSSLLTEIAERFGSHLIAPDGSLNRSAMAEVVFSDPQQRRQLEKIIHPEVRKRALKLLNTYRGHPLIVLDIPLLYETGYHTDCDKVAVVSINDQQRYQRLEADRGMTPAQIRARLEAQMPQEDKIARADFVIDNSSTRQNTARQVAAILHQLFPNGLPQPIIEPPPASL